jgi:hypothetical protein
MKTFLKSTILFIVLAVLSIPLTSDIISENTHYVSRNVIITNIDNFPDMEFIGYVSGPILPDNPIYIIHQNEPLTKGYKHNDLYIVGIEKSMLESLGGIEKMDEATILSKTSPNSIPSSGGYYYHDSSILDKDDLYYEIVNSNNDINAVLKKRILGFKDGTSSEIKY